MLASFCTCQFSVFIHPFDSGGNLEAGEIS
jgi:hypothetical protein